MKGTSTIEIGATLVLAVSLVACGDDSAKTGPGGSDGGGNDATTGDDGGGNDGGGHAVDCTSYCTKVLAACPAPYAQYHDNAHCMNMCAKFKTGAYADSDDSLGCRTYHADNVKSPADQPVHCPHAGPYGGDACGSRCGDYCALALSLCTTANGNPQPYADLASCTALCTGGTFTFDPDAGGGEFDPADKGKLNCLEYHLREAYTEPDGGAAQTHCPHLANGDGGACN
jgi:hypothetical protein